MPCSTAYGIEGRTLLAQLQLLRNFGQFDSVSTGASLPFAHLTMIYAENGRGKTSLAAMLRSLGNGDSNLIGERQRLGSTNNPHLVVGKTPTPPAVFENGSWSVTLPDIVVFDDSFVAANVCSGMEIGAGHRQNLHELILAAQGVALNASLQAHVTQNEEHVRALREKEGAIPATARGVMSVEGFCSLEPVSDLENLTRITERDLAAARAGEAVQQRSEFRPLALPAFDPSALDALLQRNLAALDQAAAASVQNHLASIGTGGEFWVADGMSRIADDTCPFCAQDLSGSLGPARFIPEATTAVRAASSGRD